MSHFGSIEETMPLLIKNKLYILSWSFVDFQSWVILHVFIIQFGCKTELGFWNGLCPLLNRKLYEMHRWLFVLFKILEKWLIGKNNYTVWAVSCKFASVSFDLGFQIWVSWNWLECHWTVFLHWSDCTWLSRLLCIFFFLICSVGWIQNNESILDYLGENKKFSWIGLYLIQ